jgi:hypothetical protein
MGFEKNNIFNFDMIFTRAQTKDRRRVAPLFFMTPALLPINADYCFPIISFPHFEIRCASKDNISIEVRMLHV